MSSSKDMIWMAACLVALQLVACAPALPTKNSKFENPKEGREKQTNSKFEIPARADEEFHNSKFKEPDVTGLELTTNSKFEVPDIADIEVRLEVIDPEGAFTNSKFKDPSGTDPDNRPVNSKFEHPLLLSDEPYKTKPRPIKITNSKFQHPEQQQRAKAEAPPTPFVFLVPEEGGAKGAGKGGVFAFMSNGMLRPLFAAGEKFGDSVSLGLSHLHAYQAQAVDPVPFGAKNKGILKFFGSFADKDFPYAY